MPPPVPDHYFNEEAEALARAYVEHAARAREAGDPVPETLERDLMPLLDNTWGDTAKAIVNNWLGLVYQLTDVDRRRLFMPGVDPEDPLGILARR